MDIEVFIELCREGAVLPEYAKPGDAGMDVFAAEDVMIKPGETAIIPTGIKLAIPEGFEIQVRPRSGISYKTPLRIANSPGTIDSGYRDELGIIMSNSSVAEFNTACCVNFSNEILTLESKGNKMGTYKIRKGDRIAQIVLQELPRIKFTVVESVKDIGTNRGGGFGSTGV
ncbi:MAG TPA: dUTP diphosphatase [Clostridiales bacterium]|nr:dUTP diphosphatase [Clostridiales bacterium]